MSTPAPLGGGSIEIAGLRKRYGPVTVLDDVSMGIAPGRVHALMGENGAGKSTLIKALAGVITADRMTVTQGGAPLALGTPEAAARAGFRFIHQELAVVPQLSVAENILLGHRVPHRLGFLVDWGRMARRASAALEALGAAHIDPRLPAGRLAMGDRMLVMLASALVTAPGGEPPCLYVLDEPTAALQEAEVAKLFAVLRRLAEQGAAVLYVSHRMDEIEAIAEDVTVLRNGRRIATRSMAETDRAEIITDMTGQTDHGGIPPRRGAVGSDVVVAARGLATRRLTGLSFDLRAGEILGVAGLAGAGQTALTRVFLGEGRVLLGSGQVAGDALPRSPAEAWARGVAYVPGERRAEGLMMGQSVTENMRLAHLRGLWSRAGAARRWAEALARAVGLRYGGPDQPVWQLSGGNQQKVVFARALADPPKLLLLEEPTRGVDVGARAEIYALVRGLAERGTAVILTSSDLPELTGLSDRILVLRGGRQVGLLDVAGLSPGALLAAIYGEGEDRAA